jgi:radical SAM superfamily enzyme YgiQ (UPF0313 family)
MEIGIISFGAGASPNTGKRAKNSLGQGCHIVSECCRASGIEVHDLHQGWRRVDVLMVGLYWWEHLYDLVKLLASRGIEPRREKRAGRPIIFLGGQLVSYNPGPAAGIADLCCIGDGEEAAPAVLRLIVSGAPPSEWAAVPGIYVSELDNRAVWQQVSDISGTLRWPYRHVVRSESDAGIRAEERFERRIEIARGCLRKCAFCGVSWTKRYRELPAEAIAEAIRGTDGCVKSFAPDPMAHSGWDEIERIYDETGRRNQARDISTKVILRRGFGKCRVYSTGIDGLSERLRSALCKPLTADELVRVVELAWAHMGSLGVYQILDLPGERGEDYAEWFAALMRVRPQKRVETNRYHGPEGGFYLMAGLNAFCPTPHTPLQWEGISLEPSCWERYSIALEAMGSPESRLLRHKTLGRPHGAVSRVLEAIAVRGDPALSPLVIALSKLRPKLASQHHVWSVARKLGLEVEARATIAPRPLDRPLPWERRVVPLYPREVLLRARAKYHRIADGATAKAA